MKSPTIYSILFLLTSISAQVNAQEYLNNSIEYNENRFNSVFRNTKYGDFEGTINGVLFLKNTAGQDLILDFQGSPASLKLKPDEDEIYDVSWKNYIGYTTSQKSYINYQNYAFANRLKIIIASKTFSVGIIDGDVSMIVKGLKYEYRAEKSTEYLILSVEKEIILDNALELMEEKGYDEIKDRIERIKLMPHSVVVFAISRK